MGQDTEEQLTLDDLDLTQPERHWRFNPTPFFRELWSGLPPERTPKILFPKGLDRRLGISGYDPVGPEWLKDTPTGTVGWFGCIVDHNAKEFRRKTGWYYFPVLFSAHALEAIPHFKEREGKDPQDCWESARNYGTGLGRYTVSVLTALTAEFDTGEEAEQQQSINDLAMAGLRPFSVTYSGCADQEIIRLAGVDPTKVVKGRGLQVVYLLKEPINVNSDAGEERALKLLKLLTACLTSDPTAISVHHRMRVPGCVAHLNGEVRAQALERPLDPTARISEKQIIKVATKFLRDRGVDDVVEAIDTLEACDELDRLEGATPDVKALSKRVRAQRRYSGDDKEKVNKLLGVRSTSENHTFDPSLKIRTADGSDGTLDELVQSFGLTPEQKHPCFCPVHVNTRTPCAGILFNQAGKPGIHCWRCGNLWPERTEPLTLDAGLAGVLDDGAAPCDEKPVVPAGWELSDKGIARMGAEGPVPITFEPMFIVGDAACVGGGREVTLTWKHRGKWTKKTVDRAVIADAHRILALASDGAPVAGDNAHHVVSFLRAFEAANDQRLAKTTEIVSRKMGWVGDHGFLLGAEFLPMSAGTVRFVGDVAEEDPTAASGSMEEWLKVVTEVVKTHPTAAMMLYASLAAPLLKLLEMEGFAVELVGPTSRGKTTALRLAASVWGRPNQSGLLHGWDTTSVGRERLAEAQCDLPLILDDTQVARRKGEDVIHAIYQLTSGKGRTRGATDGLRVTPTWRTILLSTGERSSLSLDPGAGGAAARVLSFWGSPFGDDPVVGRAAAERVKDAVTDHHGVAGRLWIKWIIEQLKAGKAEKWKNAVRAIQRHLLKKVGDQNAVAGRLAESMALLGGTQVIAREALGLPNADAAVFAAWERLVARMGETDRPKAAFIQMIEWATGHESAWFRVGKVAQPPFDGWAGRWDGADMPMHWLPSKLRDVLEEAGYPGEATVRMWVDRGWLAEGREVLPVKIAGKATRVCRIDPATVAKLTDTPEEGESLADIEDNVIQLRAKADAS